MRHVTRWLLIALMLLGLPLPARADDAALGRMGETVYPMQENNLRMASERVELKVGVVRTAVDVSFTFVNEGPARNVLMGFPIGVPGGECPAVSCNTDLADFRAWVDGTPLTVVEEPGAKSVPGQAAAYTGWKTFTVPFAAGEQRTVRNEYRATNHHWSNGDVLSGYILKTGALWKGPIGRAEVVVTFDGIFPGQIFQAEPKGFKWVDEQLVWQMANVEPDQDITFIFQSRPEMERNDTFPESYNELWDAVWTGGDGGLAQVQALRQKYPNQGATPDALDMALAKFEYLYGDKGVARTIVQAALAAGWYNPTVIYLAVREKLEAPGRFMLFSNTSLGLRQYLVDARGPVEEPTPPVDPSPPLAEPSAPAAPATPPAEPVATAPLTVVMGEPDVPMGGPLIEANPQVPGWAAPLGFTVVLAAGLVVAWFEFRRT